MIVLGSCGKARHAKEGVSMTLLGSTQKPTA